MFLAKQRNWSTRTRGRMPTTDCPQPSADSNEPSADSRLPTAEPNELLLPSVQHPRCNAIGYPRSVCQSVFVGATRRSSTRAVEQSSSSSIDESRQSRAVANAVAVAVDVAAKIETKLNNNVRSTIDLKAKLKQKGPTSVCNVQWGGSNADSPRLWWLPQAVFPYCASSVSTTTTRTAVQNLKEKQQKTKKKKENRFARLVCLPFAQFGRRKMRLPSC